MDRLRALDPDALSPREALEGEYLNTSREAFATALDISAYSLAALARAAGEPGVDARRFRMLVEIDGVAAHEEDAWIGTTVRIGAALVRVAGHVGRCSITTRPTSPRVTARTSTPFSYVSAMLSPSILSSAT